jgi:hypothetical protein
LFLPDPVLSPAFHFGVVSRVFGGFSYIFFRNTRISRRVSEISSAVPDTPGLLAGIHLKTGFFSRGSRFSGVAAYVSFFYRNFHAVYPDFHPVSRLFQLWEQIFRRGNAFFIFLPRFSCGIRRSSSCFTVFSNHITQYFMRVTGFLTIYRDFYAVYPNCGAVYRVCRGGSLNIEGVYPDRRPVYANFLALHRIFHGVSRDRRPLYAI